LPLPQQYYNQQNAMYQGGLLERVISVEGAFEGEDPTSEEDKGEAFEAVPSQVFPASFQPPPVSFQPPPASFQPPPILPAAFPASFQAPSTLPAFPASFQAPSTLSLPQVEMDLATTLAGALCVCSDCDFICDIVLAGSPACGACRGVCCSKRGDEVEEDKESRPQMLVPLYGSGTDTAGSSDRSGAVRSLSVFRALATQLRLVWAPSVKSCGQKSYEVSFKGINDVDKWSSFTTDRTFVLLKKLKKNTKYRIRVTPMLQKPSGNDTGVMGEPAYLIVKTPKK
jgi:hypothetical protein